ncbi:MAG: glycosyltransferase [Coriobacteriales bacterium]|jgi:GalNAc-alpha-(1->4)-GalNAc-alpha-(1->3)-diNAcBac-PP-undecaprenol alpha-1,4-N-acetyl-D-galactosaminyltransferase
MRILPTTNSLRKSGDERAITALADYLTREHEARLLLLRDNSEKHDNVKAAEVIISNGECFNWVSSMNWIARQIDDFKPDISLAFLAGENPIAIAARYQASHSAPIVIAERKDPGWTTKPEHLAGRVLLPLADGAVFPTPEIERYYNDLGVSNTTVLPSPLASLSDIEPHTGKRTKRVVAVGRLVPENDYRTLIAAFAQVASEFPEHRLEIYGSGEQRNALKKQVEKLGLSQRIKLKGLKQDVTNLIADAELFVHCTVHGGTPTTLIEAMALGLPCVATDTPFSGTATLVNPGINALMVPTGNPVILAEAMRTMLSDEGLRERIGVAARRTVEHFSPEAACPRWLAYLELVASGEKDAGSLAVKRIQARDLFQGVLRCNPAVALKQYLGKSQLKALRDIKRAAKASSKRAIELAMKTKQGINWKIEAQPTTQGGVSVEREGRPQSRESEPIAIAFVIHDLAGGGAERVVATLANHLAHDNRVSVVLYDDQRIDYELDPAVKVICHTNDDDPAVIRKFKAVYLGLREAHPDVAVSFLPNPNLTACVAKLLPKTDFKLIVSERNCPHHAYKNKRRRKLNEFMYRFADGGAFQTDAALEYWSRWCRNARKLPNPLNPVILATQPRPKITERAHRIVNVGRLVPQKNQDQLIRSFARIANEFPLHTLEIFGNGPLRDELASLAEELGVGESVVFHGRIDSNAIGSAIQDAELFVLPSLWEGLPNALIEAMALGLPCIASDCSIGGPRELIDDGVDGLLVPVGDEDALAEAMRELLGNPTRAEELGERAMQIVERYEAPKVVRAWEGYIHEVAMGSHGAGA